MAKLKHSSLDYARFVMRRSGRRDIIVYKWRGLLCARRMPAHVRNPRTEAQQCHRSAFGWQMRVAGMLGMVLNRTMRNAARRQGLSAYNLFVRLNADAMSEAGVADWSRVQVAMGYGVAVSCRQSWLEGHRMVVVFDPVVPKGHRLRDAVRLCLFNPEKGEVRMSAAVERASGQVEALLPETWRGQRVVAWLVVKGSGDEYAPSAYVGECMMPSSDESEPSENLMPRYEEKVVSLQRPIVSHMNNNCMKYSILYPPEAPDDNQRCCLPTSGVASWRPVSDASIAPPVCATGICMADEKRLRTEVS